MGSFFLHLLIRAPGSYQSGSLQRGHYLVRDKSPREGVKIIGAIQAISNLGANDLKSYNRIPGRELLTLCTFSLALSFSSQKRKRERARGKTSWTCLQSGAPMVIGAQGWTGSFFFFLCRGKKKEERWEMICKRLERLITIRIQENASRKVVN